VYNFIDVYEGFDHEDRESGLEVAPFMAAAQALLDVIDFGKDREWLASATNCWKDWKRSVVAALQPGPLHRIFYYSDRKFFQISAFSATP